MPSEAPWYIDVFSQPKIQCRANLIYGSISLKTQLAPIMSSTGGVALFYTSPVISQNSENDFEVQEGANFKRPHSLNQELVAKLKIMMSTEVLILQNYFLNSTLIS